ncbi:MAG: hypothetical protein LUI04_06530 [Porphyromonadaceae bacterium]|nr:hypothetical protein [Porphyromonadaceae bacterium]
MVYKFLILSDEVDRFSREIEIDSEATFLELNDAILESVGYTKDQLTSFFICENNWEKKTEVTLMEMDTDFDEDSWIMGETRLSELIEEEKQRMLFVFDNMTERAFFIELREIITGRNLKKAVCTRSVGKPPKQIIDFEEMEKGDKGKGNDLGIDEDFYGNDDYDPSELDEEGFDDLDMSDGESIF